MADRTPKETLQTRDRMEQDLKNYVLNPDVPDTIHPRLIWQNAHPGESLLQTDYIHHKNGNHDDNRLENLEKVNEHLHGSKHAEMRQNLINHHMVYGGA